MKNIAVLLTCHNRKEKSIKCLESFYKAVAISDLGILFDVFLVDDGSTDGTSAEILRHFPNINLICGSGELYWAGGMRLAWETSLKNEEKYDSFLLLNDDVILMEHFLDDMLNTHRYCLARFNQSGIYVSSTKDLRNSKTSYGGILIRNKGIKVKYIKIDPTDFPLQCSMTNANILMVTKSVVQKNGILDSRYIHQFADYDYSYTAFKKGIPILVCPGFGGICTDDHGNNWLPSKSTLKDRLNYLYSPTGLAYKEHIYYLWKNFRYQFPYFFIMLWLKTIFPFVWEKYKKVKI